MARNGRKDPSKLNDEQEEMTVILRFKSDGETLSTGFNTVGQALRQLGPPMPPPPPKALPQAARMQEQVQAADADVDAGAVASNGSGSRTPRTRKPPKMPNDLDVTTGDLPLKQYAQSKKPDTLQEKFAVIAAWFLHKRQIQEITVDHIFTCFPLIDWAS